MLTGKLITPPVSEGCLNGVMRKQVLNSQKMDHFEVVEGSRPLIYKSRRIIYHKRYQGNTAHNKIQKKEFDVVLAKVLLEKLNEVVRTIF
jgi:branched-chain amino acid aminotransferase